MEARAYGNRLRGSPVRHDCASNRQAGLAMIVHVLSSHQALRKQAKYCITKDWPIDTVRW